MNRSLTRALLVHLAQFGTVMVSAFLPPQYPEARFARYLLGLPIDHYPSRKAAQHSFSSTLHRLKREGLVANAGSKKKTVWTITKKGRVFLNHAPSGRETRVEVLPPVDRIVRLVTFDVPEKQRQKRDWLRRELIACGYDMLQRSVFIGARPLPAEFIKTVEELGLTKNVHIVSIDKKGTLAKSPQNAPV